MKFSCHYHCVILLDIATVCYVIFCDSVIPHALYVYSQLQVVSYDVYINAQMIIIMFNDELLGLLMIIIEYLMI